MCIKQNIENFSTQNSITMPRTSQEGPKCQFLQGKSIGFSQKTEHYQLLSLSSLFLVLVRMHFPNSAFIYTKLHPNGALIIVLKNGLFSTNYRFIDRIFNCWKATVRANRFLLFENKNKNACQHCVVHVPSYSSIEYLI